MSELNLESLMQQWHSIKDRDERNRFYDEQVFPVLLQTVIPREQKRYPEPYTHLILPVGLSPEPLIISILILRPKKVYFLYTKDSEKYLDRIVKDTNLRISQISQDEINETNVPEIYKKVKAIYEKWEKPERVAVDITGGKKSMVGGCSLAGSVIGARIFYIDSKFNTEFKKPDPGSEKLMILDNPYDVFGDLKLERARELFTQLDFVGAQRLLKELEQETSNPELYQARSLLCQAYSTWDDWNITKAVEVMTQTIEMVKRYARGNENTPLNNQVIYLQQQLIIIEQLKQALDLIANSESELSVLTNHKLYLPMMGTLRAGAIRQEKRGKLDVAALLWYRLIELLSQQRLSSYGLKTSSPDYSCTKYDESELLSKYQSVSAKTSSSKKSSSTISELPNPISLIQGYTLLQALEDPLTQNQKLQEIRGKVEVRDHGIFAHGFKPLSQEKYDQFKGLAENLVTAFNNSDDRNKDIWDNCDFIANI